MQKKNCIFRFLLLLIILVISPVFNGCFNNYPVAMEDTLTSNELAETRSNAFTESELPTLKISQSPVDQGDFLVFYLENVAKNDEVKLTTSWNENEPVFFDYGKGKIALAAIHYGTSCGDYPLHLQIMRNGCLFFEQESTVTIIDKAFSTQHLRVTASQNALRDPKLLAQDTVFTNEAKAKTSSAPLWESSFIMPVKGRISTEYGLIRSINGVVSGRHSGLDIAAPRGTPIKAANSGIVNLSRGLYVTGNTVIIDHGLGLYSSYSHLDKLYVQEGDTVKKGDILGEVGSTGFSTGPHLHWTISIRSTFTNPWLFLEKDPLSDNPLSEDPLSGLN